MTKPWWWWWWWCRTYAATCQGVVEEGELGVVTGRAGAGAASCVSSPAYDVCADLSTRAISARGDQASVDLCTQQQFQGQAGLSCPAGRIYACIAEARGTSCAKVQLVHASTCLAKPWQDLYLCRL